MPIRLHRRFRRFLYSLPCHPVIVSDDVEWRRMWNLRAAALRKRFAWPIGYLLMAVSVVVWPVRAAALSWKRATLAGLKSGDRAGGGRWTLWRRLMVIALRYRVGPREAWPFGLAEGDGDPARARLYVSEALALPLLAVRNDAQQARLLADKQDFFDFCRERRIDVVDTLAVVGRGDSCVARTVLESRCDVVVKPRVGSRSVGVERWDWTGELYRRAFQDTTLAPAELAERVGELSRVGDYLVQPRLRNHRSLEDLSNGSVIVFRIPTLYWRGVVEVIAPVAQLPFEQSAGADWNERVIPVAVDLESGILKAVLGPSGKGSRRHPLTGAEMVGRSVPAWQRGIELVRRAHLAFPGVLAVGWDLVFTQDGPILIEGNTGFALRMHQLPPLPPLRETRLWEALRDG